MPLEITQSDKSHAQLRAKIPPLTEIPIDVGFAPDTWLVEPRAGVELADPIECAFAPEDKGKGLELVGSGQIIQGGRGSSVCWLRNTGLVEADVVIVASFGYPQIVHSIPLSFILAKLPSVKSTTYNYQASVAGAGPINFGHVHPNNGLLLLFVSTRDGSNSASSVSSANASGTAFIIKQQNTSTFTTGIQGVTACVLAIASLPAGTYTIQIFIAAGGAASSVVSWAVSYGPTVALGNANGAGSGTGAVNFSVIGQTDRSVVLGLGVSNASVISITETTGVFKKLQTATAPPDAAVWERSGKGGQSFNLTSSGSRSAGVGLEVYQP